ncbi:hypothetical protein [Mesorhizobium qingshengii]|uniref:hypothetical protein n=1 Tax=Mesorhizobium qingshengii TaxID=1165689 RepID=UPI001ABF7F3C|nr:hypothetical protein [Mesorhizobium qingshengii]
MPGSFAIAPAPDMVDALRRDYINTIAMIFGTGPSAEEILASAAKIEANFNDRA